MSTCTARRKNGGGPCKAQAVSGTNVCRLHGGNAPQVRRRAAQRLLEASDAAAAYLVRVVEDDTKPDAIRLAAARDLLDRAGLSAKQELQLEVGPVKEEPLWQQILPDILITVPTPAGTPGVITIDPTTPAPMALGAVPPADSDAAREAGEAARKVKDPVPPGWVERVDGPRPRQGRKRR